MKTLIELKQAAESKGLRFEVNKWDPTIKRWSLFIRKAGKMVVEDSMTIIRS